VDVEARCMRPVVTLPASSSVCARTGGTASSCRRVSVRWNIFRGRGVVVGCRSSLSLTSIRYSVGHSGHLRIGRQNPHSVVSAFGLRDRRLIRMR
jgi:hypothetical protein